MNQGFSVKVLTKKPLLLLPLHGACTEPLALSDSDWGSERMETCPERSEWREGVEQARGPVINLFHFETYLKHISLTQHLKQIKTVECRRFATLKHKFVEHIVRMYQVSRSPEAQPKGHTLDYELSRPSPVIGCHPERSEGSRCPARQLLRCAQDDSLDRLSRPSCRSWSGKFIIEGQAEPK